MFRTALLFLLAAVATAGGALDVGKTIKAISDKYQTKEFEFEGELTLRGQRGAEAPVTLAHAKVKFASAPGGKYYLRIDPEGKDSYVLVSNGQKSWAWVPKLKQYTEEEFASAASDEDAADTDDKASDTERDQAETFARLVMPRLAALPKNIQAADFSGEFAVKFENRKERWPLLRVMSAPAGSSERILTQLAVDTESMAIGHMVYSVNTPRKGEKNVVEMTIDFSSFRLGSVANSTFTLEPPKGSKLVDAVPIPGQTGSFLLHRPAPDFELKTMDGEKVHLSELRGRPVLLSFWASWCGPCRQELPGLSALNDEYRSKGLVIYGVNDEGKGTARKFTDKAGLSFPTLDDSNRKVAQLYRVHFLPSVFVIDKDGNVVLFLRGSRQPAAIRAALASVGL